jgi:D-glycero-D-manno-heptose 1,7-bisphosphate phosphatase
MPGRLEPRPLQWNCMPADVPTPRRRAAFLDRDGVLNFKHPDLYYVLTPDRFQLLPGAAPGLKLLAAAGFRLFVVTNQRAVARGRLSVAALAALHAKMERELASAGVALDAIYVCPHDTGQCNCRKPAPGLLLQALREYPDLIARDCILFGDSASDLEAARRAGVPALQIPVNGSLEDAVRAWLAGKLAPPRPRL